MKKLIKMELKKAICSKLFLLGFLLLLLFAMLSAWFMIENRVSYNPDMILSEVYYENGKFKTNPDLPLFGFYNSWVGGEVISLAQSLFYNLLPIGAAIPFAWSYHTERKNGYLKNIASRTDKKKYFIAKAIAVFTSGALVVLIPIIVNIALISAFVPAIAPFAGYTFYNYLYIGDMWIEYYFSNPLVYILLYVLLDTLYGGLFALFSLAVSFIIHKLLAVLFLPYVFLIIVNYIHTVLMENINIDIVYEFSPTTYLHSLMYGGQRVWWIILFITIGLLLISVCTIVIRGFRDEIF